MSAGAHTPSIRVDNDISKLAPKFSLAVAKAIAMCADAGLNAVVYEANRSAELQALYYERGRTVFPPHQPVTNARSQLYSWHGYGLAVDVIHAEHGWDMPADWFKSVAVHFRLAQCRWGGEWKMQDLPHFQWGLCRPTPSASARALMTHGGLPAVWKAVGAI